jgi:hypothetical protein
MPLLLFFVLLPYFLQLNDRAEKGLWTADTGEIQCHNQCLAWAMFGRYEAFG